MKTFGKAVHYLNALKKVWLPAVVVVAGLYLSFNVWASPQSRHDTAATKADTLLAARIRAQLNDRRNEAVLNYPASVARFYAQCQFQPVWVNSQKSAAQTWQAMLLLDCVLQFGLSHDDYHPTELSYNRLHDILEKPLLISDDEKVRYDLILTDALITFINHLHYGKLNPVFSQVKIDRGTTDGFNASDVLIQAVGRPDFRKAVLSVQPKAKIYTDLQYHMHLLEGVYQGDCYDIPDSMVRKMAINMERLRWAAVNDSADIHINIPSFTLSFHRPDTTYQFKVVVGKPAWQSPVLNSAISYFTTAPEWKIPKKIFAEEIYPRALRDITYLSRHHYGVYDASGNYIGATLQALKMVKNDPDRYYVSQFPGCDNSLGLIVFRFPNIYDIYLHDTPEQQFFKREERDFSHGCIRVEHAEQFAGLLLKYDGSANLVPAVHRAIAAKRRHDFKLKRPVPIKITYLTCEMKSGVLVTYKDIYDLDKRLEMALYNVSDPLAMK